MVARLLERLRDLRGVGRVPQRGFAHRPEGEDERFARAPVPFFREVIDVVLLASCGERRIADQESGVAIQQHAFQMRLHGGVLPAAAVPAPHDDAAQGHRHSRRCVGRDGAYFLYRLLADEQDGTHRAFGRNGDLRHYHQAYLGYKEEYFRIDGRWAGPAP